MFRFRDSEAVFARHFDGSVMFMTSNGSTQTFRLPSRRLTGRLIKVSLCSVVGWFAYQLAIGIGSRNSFQESPVATIAFLALALTVAAYVAMRQQADLLAQTSVQTVHSRRVDMERMGLLGAIDEASDAVVIADSDGTIQYVNPAFTRMTGYNAEEVIGRNSSQSTFGLGITLHKKVLDIVTGGNVWHG